MRTTCIRTLGIALVMAIGLALAAPAHAVIVTYTVGGWGPQNYPGQLDPRVHATPYGAPHSPVSEGGDGLGYPGDAVGLVTYTGTLDLTPGTHVQKINTLSWKISYTYAGTDDNWHNDATGDWLELQFPINAARNMSFGAGPAGSLSQTGLLEINWVNDFLGVNAGSTTTFSLIEGGEIYQIDVTPLGVARTGGSSFPGFPLGTPWGQPDKDMMAKFVVTDVGPVPEPATIIVWSLLGAGGWLGIRVVRRRGGSGGRQPWSNENRTAILEVIARGVPR